MKTGMILLLLHKQAHDKRATAESLHVYKTMWVVFSREISQLSKMHSSPFIEEALMFIAHGHIFEKLRYMQKSFLCMQYCYI